MIARPALGLLFGVMCCSIGCADQTAAPVNEVIVMGTIHDAHLRSRGYDLATVNRIVRAVDPDYILCEIPPDRFEIAWSQFQEDGVVSEPRVARFPEYTHAVFPLAEAMKIKLVPVAAWTESMSEARRARFEALKSERPDDHKAVTEAWNRAEKRIEAEGIGDDPAGIHSKRYDEIVQRGMAPYGKLYNEPLADGGWENINAAHMALINQCLDAHRGEGNRFLITFGAWHKYWFLSALAQRDDIRLRPLTDFLP